MMDCLRLIFLSSFLLISTILNASPPLTDTTGIVFIHGTNDHRLDAEGSYWKHDYIETISSALPNPENHLVVHCDFSHYMWHEEAAGCVTNQILEFAKTHNLSSLVLYTHSNGANVTRWILSNPTYDPRYLEVQGLVKKVVALAPSSFGTPLADEALSGNGFESGLGWLLGYNNNAVRQQRVSDMAIFNESLLFGSPSRPSMSSVFKVIVGTSVAASPMSSSSYCNGYVLNAALKLTGIYLDKCSDGFLNCSSQEAAGELWFKDIDKTEGQLSLSHNQSRHTCFGLGDILIKDLQTQGVLS